MSNQINLASSPKKEDKQDVEMMKAGPDMNKITYKEEKTALIYSLLVFVIKYVYIKTPTPVISAHKF